MGENGILGINDKTHLQVSPELRGLFLDQPENGSSLDSGNHKLYHRNVEQRNGILGTHLKTTDGWREAPAIGRSSLRSGAWTVI